jgi:hypothetical protein
MKCNLQLLDFAKVKEKIAILFVRIIKIHILYLNEVTFRSKTWGCLCIIKKKQFVACTMT